MKPLKKIGCSFMMVALSLYQTIFAVSQQAVYGPPRGMGMSYSSRIPDGIVSFLATIALPIILLVGLIVYLKDKENRSTLVTVLLSVALGVACLSALYFGLLV